MMTNTKSILVAVGIIAFALIGVALYEQHVLEWFPCPYCVLQRYAFVTIGIVCLVSSAMQPRAARIGAGVALLAALIGAGLASYHVWIQAHPGVSCGIDPLETSLNKIAPAKLLPWLFRADGICTTPYPDFLGLSTPQWSLVWFVILAIALGWTAFRRAR
jgi:disulfide bond formation protein DsbB